MASNASVPPWRQPPPTKNKKNSKYESLGMKANTDPARKATMMYAPPANRGASGFSETDDDPFASDEPIFDFDPDLKLAFSRNFQFLRRVFSFDTLLRPLPSQLGRTVARNLGFLTRIFTQFFDQKGIQNARRSIGLGEEDRRRSVR
ncbi:hypothetical protein O6H91_12G024000 [Diphasiastrum complanatum]|uniref:Uncharacterized protein n=1 Tax=Diphasiastrum complanatum TaxID=34168 RepID=A0ACC2BZY1_DIPCM|nr:hypothetical protein O6H91_12G024000 [Diphasiastrum complanatum]